MYCYICGHQNPDDAKFCTACGQPQPSQTAPAPPSHGSESAPPASQPVTQPSAPVSEDIDNYLGLAIFSTICCCLPTGIVAIVNAAQVNGKLASGDIEGARECSNSARGFSIASVVLGLASAAIYAIYLLA